MRTNDEENEDIMKEIEDQLMRNESSETGEKSIGLIQLAATSDLIGLRATQINVTENQIGRLQLPAIAIRKNKPIILWSADMVGQTLISCPEEGQIKVSTKVFISFSSPQ